jgi:hypothetical protein
MMALPVIAALTLQVAPEQPQAVIEGRVVSLQAASALAGAHIQIATVIDHRRVIRSTVSTDDGAFSFRDLPPGAYSLSALKSGYQADTSFPLRFELHAGERREGLVLRFRRSGVITGNVTGPDGEPSVAAKVRAYQVNWSEGRGRGYHGYEAMSDDRGQYRIFGLPAGRYVVAASAPGEDTIRGELARADTTYFPSGRHPSEAAAVALGWGQELSEIDLTLRFSETFFISGHIADALTNGPCQTCTIRINRLDDIDDLRLADRRAAPDGSYRIDGLVPGVYRISAEKLVAQNRLISAATVTVQNRDVSGVNLLAGVERSLSGRVVLESPPPEMQPDRPALYVELRDGIEAPPGARVRPDGSFAIAGLSPIPYRIRVQNLPNGAYLRAVRLGGQELPGPEVRIPERDSVTGMEVVLAFDGGAVTGTVLPPESAGEGHRVTAAAVVLWPEDGQSSYLIDHSTGTDPQGTFQFEGLPPGAYTAFALPVPNPPDLGDPQTRRRLSTAGRAVHVESGRTTTVELVLASGLDFE